MSQSKTVIQGLETMEVGSGPQSQPQNLDSSFYSRSSSPKGTVISGITDNAAAAPSPKAVAQPTRITTSNKPVVGFLYSISKTASGEFWPLTIGSNTIGTNADSHIVLSEGTVSGVHATLQVRRDKKSGHISAWVSDTMSTNGTMINDITLGSTPLDCKNGDIITIGDNYQLYLVLIDAVSLGLAVSEDFIPIATSHASDPFDIPSYPESPDFFGSQHESATNANFVPNDGTVGLDGSIGINKGGTVGL